MLLCAESPGLVCLAKDGLPQQPEPEMPRTVLVKPAATGHDRFEWLAEQVLKMETQRMERGDLSRAAVGILRNRLQAHVMPFFRDRLPSHTDAAVLEAFVQRLTAANLSTTTMSQYLVVVRKLLKQAIRHGCCCRCRSGLP